MLRIAEAVLPRKGRIVVIHIPQGERIDGRGDGTCCENATVADADLATRTGLNRRTQMYCSAGWQLLQDDIHGHTNNESLDGVIGRHEHPFRVRRWWRVFRGFARGLAPPAATDGQPVGLEERSSAARVNTEAHGGVREARVFRRIEFTLEGGTGCAAYWSSDGERRQYREIDESPGRARHRCRRADIGVTVSASRKGLRCHPAGPSASRRRCGRRGIVPRRMK